MNAFLEHHSKLAIMHRDQVNVSKATVPLDRAEAYTTRAKRRSCIIYAVKRNDAKLLYLSL